MDIKLQSGAEIDPSHHVIKVLFLVLWLDFNIPCTGL